MDYFFSTFYSVAEIFQLFFVLKMPLLVSILLCCLIQTMDSPFIFWLNIVICNKRVHYSFAYTYKTAKAISEMIHRVLIPVQRTFVVGKNIIICSKPYKFCCIEISVQLPRKACGRWSVFKKNSHYIQVKTGLGKLDTLPVISISCV